ncbi:MAG: hypothetical protein GX575_17605, partial [Candidatus Anammoximicrobium sp.]|nr:hypothetical protein [Candidatus Anammoximicrobium sp.]
MLAIYVDFDATGNNDGSTWTHAYRSLQDALGAAQAGDEIWVAEGTYNPDQGSGVTPGDRSATFQLKNNVNLYGGFAGGETSLSQRDWVTHATVLSGDLNGNDGANFTNYGENSYSVLTAGGTVATASLDGFTVTGGNSNVPLGYPDNAGGGMLTYEGSSLTIGNCTFVKNWAVFGGAIVNNGELTVVSSTFSGNEADRGGGAIDNYGALTLRGCAFIANAATNTTPSQEGRGGALRNVGIYPDHITADFVDCSFLGNWSFQGGAMTNQQVNLTITNCVFSGNKAIGNSGGAMHSDGWTNPVVINSTFAGNTATVAGGAIYQYGTSITLNNDVFWANSDAGGSDQTGQINPSSTTVTVNHSSIQGWTGSWGGTGNIGSNPLFVDADGVDNTVGTADDNLRISGGSPAIDAADNSAVPSGATTDRDGNPRFIDDPATTNTGSGTPPIVDMGAYEFGSEPFLHFDFESNNVNSGTLGAGHNGTTYGNASYSTDAIRGQYSVNMGTDGYVKVPAFAFGNTATVTTWVKGDFTGPVEIIERDGMNTVFSTRSTTSSPSGALLFVNHWATQNRAVAFESGDTSTYQGAETPAGVVESNAWHHLALTINRPADTVQIYVDGSLQKTGTGAEFFQTFTDNQALYIGAPGTLMWWHFRGNIDDFRVYGSVLSASEIAGMAFQTDTTPPTVTGRVPTPSSTITTASVNIDVTFSEAVKSSGPGSPDATDLVLTGSAAGGAAVGTPTNTGGNTWRFPVSGLTSGTLNVSLAPDANDLEDLGGNDLVNVTWGYSVSLGGPTTAEFGFALRAGSTSNDWGKGVATDAAGNVYVTGIFQGTVDFDPGAGVVNLTSSAGGEDVFVAQYTAAGALGWVRQLGASGNDEGYGIAVDGAGNVYTTGCFEGTVDFDPGIGTYTLTSAGYSDVFISKLDSAGNFLWARKLGGSDWYDLGRGITFDGSGNVYTTGTFQGTADFDPGVGTYSLTSAGYNDVFVSKLDSAGNFLWARGLGGTSGEECESIVVDGSGNVYTAGTFQATVDFDPGSGSHNLTAANSDVFVSKLDSAGNFVWARQWGGTASDGGHDIALDGTGNLYTTGVFDSGAGAYDIFVIKLDTAGNFLWTRQMGGSTYDYGFGIAVDGGGNVYSTGFFSGAADFDPGPGTANLTSGSLRDVFVSKLDSAGNYVWAYQWGGNSYNLGEDVAVDGDGNVYTTGWFQGTADFDPGISIFNLTSAGGGDMFLSKLTQSEGDMTPPTVTDRVPAPSSTITTASVNIDVTFSEAVKSSGAGSPDATDLVLTGTASGGATVGTPTNTAGNTWQFPVSGLVSGTLNVSLAPDADDIEDAAGNDLDPRPTSWSYIVEVVGSEPILHFEFESNNVNCGTLGTSHNGTTYGDASYSTDAIRGQYSVNMGTDGYVRVPAFAFGNTATVTTWVKGDFTGPIEILARDGMNTVFSTRSATDSPSGALWYVNNWNTQNRAVVFESGDTSTYQKALTPDGVVQTNVWHHLALTINRPADTIQIYVDGTLQKTGTGSEFIQNFTDNQAMYIGAPGTLMWWHFTGNIDDFRVYGSVLSAAEIAGMAGQADTTPPTVTDRAPTPSSTITTASVNIDVTFSEAVKASGVGGVDASDLVLTGTAATGATVGTPTNTSGNTWQFPVSGLVSGTLNVSLAPDANDIEDLAGNDLANLTWSYSVSLGGLAAPVLNAEPATTLGTTNTVSWTAVPGADQYLVEYDTSSSFSSPDGNSGWITDTQYTFTGLTSGQTYYYHVKARKSVAGDMDSWTQTTQADFESSGNVRVSVSTTSSPGSVVLAGGGSGTEITGRVANPSFESSLNSWTTGYTSPDWSIWSSSLWHTAGSSSLAFASWGDVTKYSGDNAWARQTIDLTGISTIKFDASWYSSTVTGARAEVRIDSTVLWTKSTAGTALDQAIDVSSYSGSHTLEFRLYFTATVAEFRCLLFDNVRTYGTSGYASSGTMTSTTIIPASFDHWGTLSYGKSTPSGTALTVDVLNSAGSLLASNVASGTNLAGLGLTATAIKLRANLSTGNTAVTPALSDWTVTWQEASTYVESAWSIVESSTQQLMPFTVALPAAVSEGDGTLADQGSVSIPVALDADLVVDLQSSDTSEATVPATVTILAGQMSATFDITVQDDADLDGSQSTTITATATDCIAGGDTLSVHDNEAAVLTVSVPASATEGDGVLSGAGTVTVSQAPAVDVVVQLSSNDPGEVTVPAAVTILAGQTSATFDVTIVNDTLIDGTQAATVTAHVQNWTDGSDSMDVPDNDGWLTVQLPPEAWENAGTLSGAGSVTIGGTLGTDLVVTLASSDESELQVPATVTVTAGQTTVAFDLTVVDDADQDGTQTVTVTAGAAGLTGDSEQMPIRDDELHHFAWGTIGSPQTAGVAFAATLEARNVDDEKIVPFIGTAALSGAGTGGAVPVTPTATGTFAGGAWSGSVIVSALATSVVLTADDGSGNTGVSNAFNVVSGPLDHFAWSTIASPQYQDVPFAATLTAQDALGYTVTDYSGTVDLSGWVGSGSGTVEILSFIAYADTSSTGEYKHTLQAVSTYFTSYHETSTTATSAAALQTALVAKNVFLIPEQENTTAGTMGSLGTAWASVLNNFVSSGGIVIACSHYQDEHLILQNAGLMTVSAYTTSTSLSLTKTTETVLNAGVSVPFNGSYIHEYSTSTNGQVSLRAVSGAYPVVLSRDVGAGHVVMIGTDYYTLGTGMDRVIANAVQWAQSSATPVAIAPTSAGFTNGVWTGDVTVLEEATDMYLRADDGSGHVADSNTFDVEPAMPLTVTVPEQATEGDGTLADQGTVSIPSAVGFDIVVTLQSDDATEAVVPSTVTILAGSTSATFDITIEDDAELDPAQSATITASAIACLPGTDTITVHDNETAVLSVTLPGSAAEGDGTLAGAGTVTVSEAPAVDVAVQLTSNDPSEVTVPATVTILAGQTSATFDVTIVNDTLIDGTQAATVTAHVQNWTDGSDSMDVLDNDGWLTVQLPAGAWENAATLTGAGSVTLGGTLTSNLVVTLDVDDASELSVPATVTVLAGQTTATFDVTVVDDTEQDGVQTATVTANAPGLTGGGQSMLIRDDEVHHFTWGTIGSPQTAGVAFTATLEARNVDDEKIAPFTGTAGLSGAGTDGAVNVTPGATTAFTAGAWSGNVTVNAVATNVVLTADDGSGNTGLSNVFNVVSGPLDHFAWSTVASPQYEDLPFAATLTAQDARGYTVTDYNGAVTLSGRKGGTGQVTIGTGTSTWDYPLHTYYHDSRTQVIYLQSELGGSSIITGLALDVSSIPGQTLYNWTLRMKHTSLSSYATPSFDASGWTTVYQGTRTISSTGWVNFAFSTPFVYNGTSNLLVDFSHNNSSWTSSGRIRSSIPGGTRATYTYTDSGYGNPLSWSGTTSPTAYGSTYVPNVRLTTNSSPVTITPTSAVLANGVWTGNVTVLQTATAMYLRADDGAGHVADSNTFDVAATPFDFGDAPSPYPTLAANNGARHALVSGLRLGGEVDPEGDGQPSAGATLDDTTGTPDDEDGVLFSTPLYLGRDATIEVTASAAGQLDAWIDWNDDGDWADADEKVCDNVSLTAGPNTLTVAVPATATLSPQTFARFRLSGAGGLSFTEAASDGEVEDYAVAIELAPPVLDAEPPATPGTENTVYWPAVPGADEYFVQYDDNPDFSSPEGGSGWIAGLQHTFTGLTDGTTYHYRVKTRNGAAGGTSSWTQTTQADFQTDVLSNVSVTNSPGDVVLADGGSGGEVAGRIYNPSFESGDSFSATGWTLSNSGAFDRYTVARADYFVTDGTAGLRFHTSWRETYSTGDFQRLSQSVDLTGIDTIRFDVWNRDASYVSADVLIDGTTRYSHQSSGTLYNVPIDVSSLSGTHTLTIQEKVRSSHSGISAWVAFDDFRTYGSTGYAAFGTIVSTPIVASPLDHWGELTFGKTTPGGTALTVDVLNSAGGVLTSNVASGMELAGLGITDGTIKLRANLSTANTSVTPALSDWTVTWQEPSTYVESGWSNVEFSTQDATPPQVELEAPAMTDDPTPSVTVTASDANGLPDGTAVTIDVDLNNDGDFDDAGEVDHTVAALTAGTATFDVVSALSVGPHLLRARVTDLAGNEGFDTATTVINTPPTAEAGGPYDVAEGAAVVLDASGSSDPDQAAATLIYEWDLDGDTVYDDATGPTATFSAALIDGPFTVTVGLRVTDDFGAATTDTATIDVTNVVPTAGISGPAGGLVATPYDFTFSATDPSPADMAAPFAYAVNWGDGQTTTVSGPAGGTTCSHVYADFGNYSITVTATDKDGGTGSAASHSFQIDTATSVVIDAEKFGPNEDNAIIVRREGDNVVVTVDGLVVLDTALAGLTGGLEILGAAGNDKLIVDQTGGFVTVPIVYDGGTNGAAPGDDLEVTGGTEIAQIRYDMTGPGAGQLFFNGHAAADVTFRNIEPVTITQTGFPVVTDVTINIDDGNGTPNEALATQITDDGNATDNVLFLDAPGAFEDMIFPMPSNSLTINGDADDDDTIAVISVDTGYGASLIVNGNGGNDAVNLNGDITFADGNNLDVDLQDDSGTPGTDVINVGTGANLILSGTGTATLKASRNVALAGSSSVVVVDGNLTVEANQQATPTAGNYVGVEVDGGLLQSTGTGIVTVQGTGGDDSGGSQYGVYVHNGGDIVGGTAGTNTVVGTGGSGTGSDNVGVHVRGATITSGGGDITVTGTGGGSGGASSDKVGVNVTDAGAISGVGAATVTVTGTGGANDSVAVYAGGPISAAAGKILIEGVKDGGGLGADVVVNAPVTTSAGGDIEIRSHRHVTGDADGDISSDGAGSDGNITITTDADGVGSPNGAGTIQLAGNIAAGDGSVTFSLADCDGWIGATAGGADGRVTAGNIVMGIDGRTEGVLRLRAGTGANDNNTFTGMTTVVEGTLIVNGVLSGPVVEVQAGGVLGGNGNGTPPATDATTGVINGNINVLIDGILDPGDCSLNDCTPLPGVLAVNGDVDLAGPNPLTPDVSPIPPLPATARGIFRVQLNGLASSTQYDQLLLRGGGELHGAELDGANGASLVVQPGWPIPVGAEFVIVSKLPAGDWDSRFVGRPEGAFLDVGGALMNISYFASDADRGDAASNDITLTAPGRYDFNGFGNHT